MGGNAFWNFRRQGGVSKWKPSVVGYGYFLELPIMLKFFTIMLLYAWCSRNLTIMFQTCHYFALAIILMLNETSSYEKNVLA